MNHSASKEHLILPCAPLAPGFLPVPAQVGERLLYLPLLLAGCCWLLGLEDTCEGKRDTGCSQHLLQLYRATPHCRGPGTAVGLPVEPDRPGWDAPTRAGHGMRLSLQSHVQGRASSECQAGLCRQCPRGQLGPGHPSLAYHCSQPQFPGCQMGMMITSSSYWKCSIGKYVCCPWSEPVSVTTN